MMMVMMMIMMMMSATFAESTMSQMMYMGNTTVLMREMSLKNDVNLLRSANCDTFKMCSECASAKTWTGSNCRWCPKTGDCHAEGSLNDDILEYENKDKQYNCDVRYVRSETKHESEWCFKTIVGQLLSSCFAR